MKHKDHQLYCTPLPVLKFKEPIRCFFFFFFLLCVRLNQSCCIGLGQSCSAKSNLAHEVTFFPDVKLLDNLFIWALITFYWVHFFSLLNISASSTVGPHHWVVELWSNSSVKIFHATVNLLSTVTAQQSTIPSDFLSCLGKQQYEANFLFYNCLNSTTNRRSYEASDRRQCKVRKAGLNF